MARLMAASGKKKVVVNVPFPNAVLQVLDRAAAAAGQSRAEFITGAVREYMESHQDKAPVKPAPGETAASTAPELDRERLCQEIAKAQWEGSGETSEFQKEFENGLAWFRGELAACPNEDCTSVVLRLQRLYMDLFNAGTYMFPCYLAEWRRTKAKDRARAAQAGVKGGAR